MNTLLKISAYLNFAFFVGCILQTLVFGIQETSKTEQSVGDLASGFAYALSFLGFLVSSIWAAGNRSLRKMIIRPGEPFLPASIEGINNFQVYLLPVILLIAVAALFNS